MAALTSSEIYAAVSSHYSAASTGRTANGQYEDTVARAFGYSTQELASIPQDANLGLSCGNPLVLASLRAGETVVDLGSGAGFDIFLAAPKVGPTGMAIGVDMNKDMLAMAERNKEKSGAQNTRFVEAPITNIEPLEAASVDCIISNCVINLIPEEEKPRVFEEMHRILKPNGRVAISDILIKDGTEMPAELKSDMALYVGCISGASFISSYETYLKQAGFRDILIINNHKDLNVYNSEDIEGGGNKSCCGTTTTVEPSKSCCGTYAAPRNDSALNSAPTDPALEKARTSKAAVRELDASSKLNFNDYAGSFNIYAVKST